ncbi:MAG TPA: NAD(+) diphosphatase [Streptosporangiaceae bacterium]
MSSPTPALRPGAAGLGRLALARGDVDRSGHLRGDDEWLAAAWARSRTRVVVIDHGRAQVRIGGGEARLVFVSPGQAPDGIRFLLGVDSDGVAYFGVDGPLAGPPASAAGRDGAAAAATEVRPATLREAGPLLPDRDAGLMTHATGLANFHNSHHFCPKCGAPSEPVLSGSARRCTAEGTDEFPRSDPAMIVLVTDPDDRILLASNAAWSTTRVSILAGFVETGESAEQAVIREVAEEVGITVTDVRYLGSQPWPLPQSLMLGFRAAAPGGQQIAVDGDEITDAGWYSRAELAAAVADGTLALPAPVSIAHQIVQSWYGAALPGGW